MNYRLITILICSSFIFCYNNPTKKINKPKPLFIKQYEERNKQEQKTKRKQIKTSLSMKEKIIEFNFDGGIKPARIKMKTPGFSIAQALPMFIKGLREEQLAACLASLGLSRWEMDR